MPLHTRPIITQILRRPTFGPVMHQIRRARLIASIGVDFSVRTALKPAHATASVAVPGVVEPAAAVVLQAFTHGGKGGCVSGETSVVSACCALGPGSAVARVGIRYWAGGRDEGEVEACRAEGRC